MIVITVVGNILVILSVLNHAPLKILSNYFVVSLAVADLTVTFILYFLIIIDYFFCNKMHKSRQTICQALQMNNSCFMEA